MKHGVVIRTSLEPDGQWFAVAEEVPEGLATRAPGGIRAKTNARVTRADTWPV